ncbi:MAG: hypothetical protein KGQ28_11165, partial [Hyphomicrobiales bacterium]|nr:hypothetical protein [Hyphomicrobiales bacterium]
NEAVRYQFSLGDYARSCQVQAKTLAIKVGVRGFALLGPKGSAGAYRAPLRVAIRRESDGKVAFSKVYAVSASIDAATGQAPFELVVPDIALPDLGDPSSDYTILVGFDSGGRFGAAPHKRRKRKGA